MHNLKRIALSALAAAALSAFVGACKSEDKAPPPPPPAATPPAAPPAAAPATPPAAAPPAAAPAAGGSAAAGGSSSIEGSVTFTGTAPEMKKLLTGADPKCPKDVKDQTVMVSGGKLGNVWIHATKGAAAATNGASLPPIEVTQEGCMYKPRMQALVLGQKIVVKNHDDTLHNVHTFLGAATAFNKAMPGKAAAPIDYTPTDEGMVKWKCDVHPWMRGFVGVAKTTVQATSGDSGSFKIDNVPPGTYTLEAWHEKLGAKTADVTVEAGKAAHVEFKFDAADKGT